MPHYKEGKPHGWQQWLSFLFYHTSASGSSMTSMSVTEIPLPVGSLLVGHLLCTSFPGSPHLPLLPWGMLAFHEYTFKEDFNLPGFVPGMGIQWWIMLMMETAKRIPSPYKGLRISPWPHTVWDGYLAGTGRIVLASYDFVAPPAGHM